MIMQYQVPDMKERKKAYVSVSSIFRRFHHLSSIIYAHLSSMVSAIESKLFDIHLKTKTSMPNKINDYSIK